MYMNKSHSPNTKNEMTVNKYSFELTVVSELLKQLIKNYCQGSHQANKKGNALNLEQFYIKDLTGRA